MICEIRDSIDSDMPFIYNAWQKSSTQGMSFEDRGKKFAEIKEAMQSGASVKVCCDSEKKYFIIGFIVFKDSEIFTYVKKTFRGFGISKKLKDSIL